MNKQISSKINKLSNRYSRRTKTSTLKFKTKILVNSSLQKFLSFASVFCMFQFVVHCNSINLDWSIWHRKLTRGGKTFPLCKQNEGRAGECRSYLVQESFPVGGQPPAHLPILRRNWVFPLGWGITRVAPQNWIGLGGMAGKRDGQAQGGAWRSSTMNKLEQIWVGEGILNPEHVQTGPDRRTSPPCEQMEQYFPQPSNAGGKNANTEFWLVLLSPTFQLQMSSSLWCSFVVSVDCVVVITIVCRRIVAIAVNLGHWTRRPVYWYWM